MTAVVMSQSPSAAMHRRLAPMIEIATQRAVTNDMLQWLSQGTPGLGVITGAEGSGKSRLLESTILTLAADEERLIGVIPGDGGKHSDAAFLKRAIAAFGASPTGRTGLELIAEFRAVLAGHDQDPRPAVLLVDDAAFGGSRLEILRSMLTAQPTTDTPAPNHLQVVLFGPEELADRIGRRQQLSSLVGHRGTVPVVPAEDLKRLAQSWHRHTRSNDPRVPALTPEGEQLLAELAEGNPGRMMRMAADAMQEAQRLGGIEIGRQLIQVITAPEGTTTGRRGRQKRTDSNPQAVQQSMPLPGLAPTPAAAENDGGEA